MRMRIFTAVFFTVISTLSFAYGQSLHTDALDPYGFVTKYDTKFEGVGPKVYILPLPRTLKEEMTDTYKEIRMYDDSIRQGLQFQRLLSNFLPTSNQNTVNTILADNDAQLSVHALAKKYTEQKNHPIVYALYNTIALDYLQQNKKKEATEALQTARTHAELSNNEADLTVIQSNLASLFLLTGQYADARDLEHAYLFHAQKEKQLANEASSYARIALIQAYAKDYKAAENTIIRKAIPLFNKSKYYDGKIEAWLFLAEIYRIQNKHTEAQWFLIQARDLAKNKSLNSNLAMIEYMLGSSKMIQNNYKVAKNELEIAKDLAKEGENRYLQLAIYEQLGRAHVYLGNYEEAKSYLLQYWEIRNNLSLAKILQPQDKLSPIFASNISSLIYFLPNFRIV